MRWLSSTRVITQERGLFMKRERFMPKKKGHEFSQPFLFESGAEERT